MPTFLDNLNLRQKIILIITIASTCVIIFASCMWGYYDSVNLRSEMIEDLTITTKELGKGMRKAVSKDDRKKIIRDLSSLKDNPGITSAWVVTPKGKVIAGYLNITTYTKKNPDVLERSYIKKQMDLLNSNNKSAMFVDKSLALKQAIILDDSVVGYIYMFSTITRLEARTVEHIEIVGGISLVSILLSVLLAFRMHRAISRPITELAKVMDGVSRNKDYSVRVKVASSKDEVGELMTIFNEMIGEIETHTILQKQNEESIKKLAYFDTLTKMPNRRLFHEYLNLVIKKNDQNQESLALLFIDLNKFKQINDTLGHDVGDILLQNIAKRIKKSLNTHEEDEEGHQDQSTIVSNIDRQLAARLGGDEFTIVVPNACKNSAIEVAEQIIHNCKQPLTIAGQLMHPSISLGIAFYPKDADNETDLMKAADLAMYHSKQQRRGTYAIYEETIENEFSENTSLENDLREALVKNEFSLVYQPILDLGSNRIIGAEALIRWQHPTRGLVYPNDFIAKCEEMHLIVDVGDFVIREACATSTKLAALGIYNYFTSINVSPLQIESTEFMPKLTAALESSAVDPRNLMIELNESILLKNVENSQMRLNQMKELGLNLAIGDYGTGYSSLRYLAMLPFDYLKIDREFISNLLDNKNYRYLTKVMLDLSKTLELNTIAEGIECDDELDFLRNNNCQFGQGFHFHKPMPYKELVKLLSDKSK